MPAVTDPRALAYSVLFDVEKGSFADALLGRALERSSLAGADRDLATMLVYGTLARRLTLDHALAEYCNRPLGKMDLPALTLLRLGLFQIVFLDRVPDYAAVGSTVAVAKQAAPWTASLVNAVLRRAAREGQPPLPPPGPQRLAVETSHPPWLIKMWQSELGEQETALLLAADNEPAPTVYRALVAREEALARMAEDGVQASAADVAPDAIVVRPARRFPGLAMAQGEASQLVVRYLAPAAGERVLDACAAPGGKAAYIARMVGPDGKVVASDAAHGSGRRIRGALAAAGVDNVTVMESAVEELGSEPTLRDFDAVLVDAPCSGLGTLRQHPEIRWRRGPADTIELAERQRRILEAAADRVRPGGRLVYATCTIARVENDDVVDGFLDNRADFTPDDAEFEPLLAPVIDTDGRMRTFPHRHGMDGFFAARLKRLG